MRINQRQFRNNIFETLLEIKAIDNGNEKTIGFCKETDMFYKWENDGGTLIVDDYFILSTGKGGDTRWIQITVSKEYIDSFFETYELDFIDGDWTLDPVLSLKYIEIEHNLDSLYPTFLIWEDNKLVSIHDVQIINNNVMKIYVTDSEEFSGKLTVKK